MALELFANLPLGRYHPGDSWLHRLDPRLKLLGLPVLVIAGFASVSPLQLAWLAAAGLVLACSAAAPAVLWWRLVWALRYLFLFTLVLHTLLSPGHTLFGQVWLSLDGLQLGGRVCCQLLLALFFSSLLTLTTKPEALAASFAGLLEPLHRLGFPVRRWADNLLLVLALIPVLQQESAQLAAGNTSAVKPQRPSLESRLQGAGQLLAELMLRVVGRADDLALALARGEVVIPGRAVLSPWSQLARLDLLSALALSVFLLLYGWLR